MRAAVRAHAAWCHRVCAANGVPARRMGGRWFAAARTTAGCPDAITLRPGLDAVELLSGLDLTAGCSVTDSWSDVDLEPHRFVVSERGEWVWAAPANAARVPWRRVGPDELDAWSRVHGAGPALPAALLGDPGTHVLLRDSPTGEACAVVTSAVPGVAGVSDLVTSDRQTAWGELRAWCADELPGRAVVGREHGAGIDAALAAGLAATGSLRLWVRPDDG